jgi:hypothetical protein
MATNESTERNEPALPELFQLNGKYRIDPANGDNDLLEDIGCLLEAAEGVLQDIVDKNEPESASAWAVMYLIRQVKGINSELTGRDLVRRHSHG